MPSDGFVFVDVRPHFRAPVFVEDVRVVVEEDAVGVEGIAAVFVVADGRGVDGVGVGGFWEREGQEHVPLAGRDAGDGAAGFRWDLLEDILDEHFVGAEESADALGVVGVVGGVGVVVELAAGGDPERFADELALVFDGVGVLLAEDDHVVVRELGLGELFALDGGVVVVGL